MNTQPTSNSNLKKDGPIKAAKSVTPPLPKRKSYQETNNVDEQLKQAAASVPLKDYDSYDIELETKQHYDDALFTSDEELNDALAKPPENKAKAVKTRIQEEPKETAKTKPTPVPEKFEFSKFIPIARQSDAKISNQSELEICKDGVNKSLVSEHILWGEDGVKPVDVESTNTDKNESTQSSIAPPKNKIDQLIRFSKGKTQELKYNVDEYFGRHLPERDFSLGYVLPILKSKKETEFDLTSRTIKKLFESKGKALDSIFKIANGYLVLLCKTDISSSYRLDLLDTIQPLITERTQDFITSVQRKPSLPGDKKRSDLQALVPAAIKYLIIACKQAYTEFYESSNVIYGPQRNKANLIAFRLLDLFLLEQRLCNALHLKVPAASLKSIDRTFMALRLYEEDFLTEEKQSYTLKKECSSTDIYTLYRAQQCFDFSFISPTQHQAIYDYVESHNDQLELLPTEQRMDAKLHYLKVTELESGKAAYISGQDKQSGKNQSTPDIHILVSYLFNQIKKDYSQCLNNCHDLEKNHSSPVFKDSQLLIIISVLSELNRQLLEIENNRKSLSFTVYKSSELSACSTLEQCRAYFHNAFAIENKKNKSCNKDSSNTDTKKEKPAKVQVSKSSWSCAMEDENYLYLQTTEDKAAIVFDLGLPILLIKPVKDEDNDDKLKNEISLGYITRLEREPQNKINLRVEKLGSMITSMDLATKSSKIQPALVGILQHSDEHFIMLSSKIPLHTGSRFKASFINDSTAVLSANKLFSAMGQHQIMTLA